MPWISGDELERLQRVESVLESTSEAADNLQSEVDELKRDARVTKIGEHVAAVLKDFETQVHIGDVDKLVTEQLIAEGKDKIRQKIAEGLKDERREAVLLDLKAQEGPAIKNELDDLFKTDGTYEMIDDETRAELRRQTAADLLDEKKKAVTEELEDPDVRASFLVQAAEDFKDDPRIVQHREEYREQMEAMWRQQAEQQALAAVEHEVLADRPAIEEKIREDYAESSRGKKDMKRMRSDAEDRIHLMVEEDLFKDTTNEVYLQVLEEQREIAARKIARQNEADKLALDFTNSGIHTAEISEGTIMELVLGTMSPKTVSVRDRSGYSSNKAVKALTVNRRIQVTAMGNDLFRVDSDSLNSSSNLYARDTALHEGAMVQLGMIVTDHKDGAQVKILRPVLRAGAALEYDTDTSTPDFTDTHLPLANIVVNGVEGRNYEYTDDQLL